MFALFVGAVAMGSVRQPVTVNSAMKRSRRMTGGLSNTRAGSVIVAAPMTKRYVAVAGTIGAGKTSLVRWLEKRYGLRPFFEPHEANPYLEDFYKDMKRWGFSSQLFFLAHKLELHQQLLASKQPAVIDRTIYEDAEIFAKNLH